MTKEQENIKRLAEGVMRWKRVATYDDLTTSQNTYLVTTNGYININNGGSETGFFDPFNYNADAWMLESCMVKLLPLHVEIALFGGQWFYSLPDQDATEASMHECRRTALCNFCLAWLDARERK